MCECGCVENDEHYTFPGPGKTFYVLSLSRGCVDCDASAGVTIEHVKPGNYLWDKENREHMIDGEVPFEDWAYGRRCVAVITGHRRHEFVKAVAPHLVGAELGEAGEMDEIGAEVVLEEAYKDSVVKPHFPAATSEEGR